MLLVYLPSDLPPRSLLDLRCSLVYSPVSGPISCCSWLDSLDGPWTSFTTSPRVELSVEPVISSLILPSLFSCDGPVVWWDHSLCCGCSWFVLPCRVACSCCFLTHRKETDFRDPSTARMSACKIKTKTSGLFYKCLHISAQCIGPNCNLRSCIVKTEHFLNFSCT